MPAILTPFFLFSSNAATIGGLILQWHGVKAFHGRADGFGGWALFLGYAVLFSFALALEAHVSIRVTLTSSAMALIFAFQCRELVPARGGALSLPRWIAIASSAALSLNFAVRTVGAASGTFVLLPMSGMVSSVMVVYLIPLLGTLLLSSSLLLLFFDRVLARERHLAAHDPVTELLNRRAFFEAALQRVPQLQQEKRPFAIAYVDLDYFKRINDDFGHARGDAVLAALARVLAASCRASDLVGRVGGDEFALFLPDSGADAARDAGRRLVRAARDELGRNGAPITVSVGIAVMPGTGDRKSWQELLSEADQALYVAKAMGRDTFHIWGSNQYEGLAPPPPTARSAGG